MTQYFTIMSSHLSGFHKGKAYYEKNIEQRFNIKSEKYLKLDLFTVNELLKIKNLSKTKITEISKLNENSNPLYLRKNSLLSGLYIVPITKIELEIILKLETLESDVKNIKDEIEKLIPKKLTDQLKSIEKEIKNLKKTIF